jgi:hypothetical protein
MNAMPFAPIPAALPYYFAGLFARIRATNPTAAHESRRQLKPA